MAFNSSFSSTQTEGAIAKIIQAIALPDSILSITSETSSSELNAALGGADGFNDLIEKIQLGAINQGIITTSDGHLASIPVSIYTNVEKTKINIFVQYNGVEKEITITNTGGTLSATVQNRTYFKNGETYIIGIGGYDGTNADEETTKSLQSVLSSSQQSLSVVDLHYSFDTLYSDSNTYESEIISIVQKVNENSNVIFKYVDTTTSVTHFYYLVRVLRKTYASKDFCYVYFNEFVNVSTVHGMQIKIVNFTFFTSGLSGQPLVLIDRHEITPYLVISESEYSTIGESANTDGILYFVTPDN